MNSLNQKLYNEHLDVYFDCTFNKFKSTKLKYSNCNNYKGNIVYFYAYFYLSFHSSLICVYFVTFFYDQIKLYQYIHTQLALHITRRNYVR